MNTERLLKLATFLETDPDARSHFNMDYWCSLYSREHRHGGEYTPDVPYDHQDNNKVDVRCATSACALGWATCIFPELSVRANTGETGRVRFTEVVLDDGSDDLPTDREAAIDFFNLNSLEAEFLFMPESYDYTPEAPHVAARIRWLIDHSEEFNDSKDISEFYDIGDPNNPTVTLDPDPSA